MNQENIVHVSQSVPFEISENIYKNLNFVDLLNVRLVHPPMHDDIRVFFRRCLDLSNVNIFTNYTVHKNLWRIVKFHEIEKEFLPENVITNRIKDIFLSDDTTNRITRENSLINLFLESNQKIINLFSAHRFEFTGKDNIDTFSSVHMIIQDNYQHVFLQGDIEKGQLKELFKDIKEGVENKTYQKSYTFIPENIRTQVNKYKKYLKYQREKPFIESVSPITIYNQSFVRIPDFVITYQKNITFLKNKKTKERKLCSSALVYIDEEQPMYVIASIFIIPFNEILFDKNTVRTEWTHIRDHICDTLRTKCDIKKNIFLKVSRCDFLYKTPILEIFQDYSQRGVTISSVLLEENYNADILTNFAHNQSLTNISAQDNLSKNYNFNYYVFFRTWYASGNNSKLFDHVLTNMQFTGSMLSFLVCELSKKESSAKNSFYQAIEDVIVRHPQHYDAILEMLFDKNPVRFSEYFLKFESTLDQETKKKFIGKIIENTEITQDWGIVRTYRLAQYFNTICYKNFNFSEFTLRRIKERSLDEDDLAYMPIFCFQYFIDNRGQYNTKEKTKVLKNFTQNFIFHYLTDENENLIIKEFIAHNDVFIEFMQLARILAQNNGNCPELLIACLKRGLFEHGGKILFNLYLSQCLENDLSNTEYKIVDKIFANISCDKKINTLPDESLLCIYFNFLYSEKTEKYRGYLSARLVQSVAEQIIAQLIERRDSFSDATQQDILEAVLTKQLLEHSQAENEAYYVNSFNEFVLDLLTQYPTVYNVVLEILFNKNPARFSEYFLRFEPMLDQDSKNNFLKKIL